MCVGDVVAETHKCVEECPVCYILTSENSLRLLSGASIQLGIVDLFIEVAQIGCRMCEMLCAMWKLNQEVEQHNVCNFYYYLRLTNSTDLSTWA
jgi:hypothetical protein